MTLEENPARAIEVTALWNFAGAAFLQEIDNSQT
jgi:hypothetical protein